MFEDIIGTQRQRKPHSLYMDYICPKCNRNEKIVAEPTGKSRHQWLCRCLGIGCNHIWVMKYKETGKEKVWMYA